MKKLKKNAVPFAVYFAVGLLLAIILFVSVNTAVLSHVIGALHERALEMPLEGEAAEELYGEFLRSRTYLSLSVDHDDIAAVEEEFAEIRGALSVGDKDGAAIAKSRLCSALGHLGRLSGFNIDSII